MRVRTSDPLAPPGPWRGRLSRSALVVGLLLAISPFALVIAQGLNETAMDACVGPPVAEKSPAAPRSAWRAVELEWKWRSLGWMCTYVDDAGKIVGERRVGPEDAFT